jgi:hypothetical protein
MAGIVLAATATISWWAFPPRQTDATLPRYLIDFVLAQQRYRGFNAQYTKTLDRLNARWLPRPSDEVTLEVLWAEQDDFCVRARTRCRLVDGQQARRAARRDTHTSCWCASSIPRSQQLARTVTAG